MKKISIGLMATLILLSPTLTLADVGGLLTNRCRVASVKTEVRTAHSINQVLDFDYNVNVAHLECQDSMYLTGGISVQNFDLDFAAKYKQWLINMQESGQYFEAVFQDLAYFVVPYVFAGTGDLAPADGPYHLLNEHMLRIQTTESVYRPILKIMDRQKIPRKPFIAKSEKAPFQKNSWTRTLQFVSSDKSFAITIDDVGPTAGRSNRWDEPELTVMTSFIQTPDEKRVSYKNHRLNEADSSSLKAIFRSYFKIHDVTTGSAINDRDVTFDCKAKTCEITID